MKINQWTNPPGRLALNKGEVQVWVARLDQQKTSDFSGLLNDEEQRRAARMRNPLLAAHFVIGRGILRCLLGAYLDADPGRLEFQYSPQGKPALCGCRDASLSFNLSHSKELAVYAFADGLQVGVDVEQEGPLEDLDAMAKMTLSPEECAELKARSGAKKQDLFYKLWTCREAVLKMTGSGWSQPLRSVMINVNYLKPGSVDVDLPDGRACTLQVFHPASGYTAALAVMDDRSYVNVYRLELIQKDVP